MSVITAESFSQEYVRGFVAVRRFLQARGVSSQSSEDFAQAAWARAWEYRESYRGAIGPIRTWVSSIAWNGYLGHLRSSAVRTTDQFDPDKPLPPALTVNLDDRIQCEEMLAKCRAPAQRILRAVYLDGYTPKELAKKWDSNPITLRVRLMRARDEAFKADQPRNL